MLSSAAPASAPLPPLTPGQKAWITYASTITKLPGVLEVSQSSAHPDAFNVVFETAELAKLGDAVMQDTVLGARVNIETVSARTSSTDARRGAISVVRPASGPWHERTSNILRAIAGLEGVWGYSIVPKPKVKFAQVHAVNAGYADHLRELVSRTLPDGTVVNIRERAFPTQPPR